VYQVPVLIDADALASACGEPPIRLLSSTVPLLVSPSA